MTVGPCDIALEHLERLKLNIRKDLDDIESKIAELESDGVIQTSRIEYLASILHTLTTHSDSPEGDGQHSTLTEASSNILQEASVKLEEILGEHNEASISSREQKVAETYTAYRNRLMNTMNSLDLVAVSLRKNAELLERANEEEDRRTSISTTIGSRSAPGSSAIIRSQELERHRIAREIHDGPAQAIANVVLRMDILAKIFEKDPTQVPDELARMKEIAQGALNEIRGFIFDLRPMTLADLGLVATIKRIVNHLNDLEGLNVRLVLEGDERPLGQLVTLTVFRIAQESINNLRKYAECETAWVHVKYLEDKIILIVEDDGVGFDVEEVTSHLNDYTSFGLLGMRERADDINADLQIKTSPGDGTKITLTVPTNNNPAVDVNWD